MADFKYPATDLDRSKRLLALLGSHWSEVYAGRYQVESFLLAWAQEAKQSTLNLLEAQASDNRRTVPVYHIDQQYQLILKESERNESSASILSYGDGAYYGNQPGTGALYVYGRPADLGRHDFPLPAGITEVPAIFNRITAPSAVLLDGIDYTVDPVKGLISFTKNPFDDGRFGTTLNLDAEGETTDRELVMWLFRSGWDLGQTYRHWGYLIGSRQDSSYEYRDLVNAALDGLLEGGTTKNVMGIMSAVCDVPLVKEDREIVEAIFTDNHGLAVVTDKTAYRFKAGSTAIVSVGDVVERGEALTDTLSISEINRGTAPSWLTGIAVGPEFITPTYKSGLVFLNQDVAVTVEYDADGKTKLSFPLLGDDSEVERFWDEVHAAGVAADETLANLLDVREDPDTEPGPASLPTTINPLEFLVQNLLRNNTFIVRIKTRYLGLNSLDLSNARHIARLIPPHTSCIIVTELEPDIAPAMIGETTVVEAQPTTATDVVEITFSASVTGAAELQYLNADCGA